MDIDKTYQEWVKDPSDENTSSYLKSLDPVIDKSLLSYAPGMEGNLKTKARLLALRATKKYDPSHNMALKSYIMQSMQPLMREYKKRVYPVKVPERHVLEKNKLESFSRDFESTHGREPSRAELADISKMSIKRIEHLFKGKTQVPEGSLLTDEGDSLFTKRTDPQKEWAHYVYMELDPVDQKIFEWSTGWGGVNKKNKKEIADKLRISAPAVSQRINKIINKLAEGSNLG